MEILKPFLANPLPSAFYRTEPIKGIIRWCHHAIANQQGLVVITGEAGMGKSSLLRMLYGDYSVSDDVVVTLIPSLPANRPFTLAKSICNQLGVPGGRAMFDQMRNLEEYVFRLKAEKNQKVLCFIDEGQAFDNYMLETLRVMLNFETDDHKLMNFVMTGTPEMWDRICKKRNKGLRSRAFSAQLLPLMTFEETRAMLDFRCDLNGIKTPFDDQAVERIHAFSGGVPRDSLILSAYAYDKYGHGVTITGPMLDAARKEVDHRLLEKAHGAA
jgi:type II secretory pathway predicted ATPase ExeA